jgi:hypothetical protein
MPHILNRAIYEEINTINRDRSNLVAGLGKFFAEWVTLSKTSLESSKIGYDSKGSSGL